MNLNNNGSLFSLQASLSLDTSDYENSIEAALSDIDDLDSAINAADGADIDISVDDADVGAATGDVDDLNESLEGVETAAGDAEGGVSSLTDNIINHLAGAVTLGAIAGLASSIAGVVSEFSAAGDAIDKTSQRFGFSREAYQEWEYVMGQSGVSMDSVLRGVNNLRTSLEDPNDEFSQAIKNLGLNINALKDEKPEDAFDAIITGLQNIEEPEERAELAMEIFGTRVGNELIPLLNTSADETKALKDEAHELGLVMSDEAVDAAVKYGDSVDKLKRSWNGLKYTLATPVVKALTAVADGMSSLIGLMNGEDNSLTGNIERVQSTFTTAVEAINGQQLNATAILDAMDALGDPTKFTDEQAKMWDIYYQKLAEVMPGIKKEFGEHVEATTGATQALREHTQSLIDDAKAAAVAQAIAARQEALTDAYAKQADALANYTVAKNKADALYNSADYQSYLQAGAAYEAEWGGVDAFIAPALNYTSAQIKAMQEYNKALTEMSEAQKTYDTITDQTAEAEASTNAWIDALYEVAGIEPMLPVAQSTADSLSKMVDDTKSAVSEINEELDKMDGTRHTTVTVTYEGNYVPNDLPGHKDGLDYVPYDNYVARLHEGERVLTKAEAAAYNRGASSADIAALAAAIANRPISFSVGDTALAVSISGASSRANAQRAATISSGYGRGMH